MGLIFAVVVVVTWAVGAMLAGERRRMWGEVAARLARDAEEAYANRHKAKPAKGESHVG